MTNLPLSRGFLLSLFWLILNLLLRVAVASSEARRCHDLKSQSSTLPIPSGQTADNLLRDLGVARTTLEMVNAEV
jgi:hypothetical protein